MADILRLRAIQLGRALGIPEESESTEVILRHIKTIHDHAREDAKREILHLIGSKVEGLKQDVERIAS